jgi:hypothetical protein
VSPIIQPDTSQAQDMGPMEPGTYQASVAEVGFQNAKSSGNPMIVPKIKVQYEGNERTRLTYLVIVGEGAFGFDQFLRACGFDAIADCGLIQRCGQLNVQPSLAELAQQPGSGRVKHDQPLQPLNAAPGMRGIRQKREAFRCREPYAIATVIQCSLKEGLILRREADQQTPHKFLARLRRIG